MNEINGSNQNEREKKLLQQVLFWSLVGVGTVSFWCCVAISVYLFRMYPQIPDRALFATLTVTHVPTPTLPPHNYLLPPEGIMIFEETFDNNDNNWDRYGSGGKVQIQDGRLILRSESNLYIGMARCFGCDYLGDDFYFQAELLPEASTSRDYGLIFCSTGMDGKYYAFSIDPIHRTYTLYKHRDDEWTILIGDTGSDAFNKFPVSNTLGVEFIQGRIYLYLNGSIIDSFADPSPYSCTWPGIFVDSGQQTLYVDNVFAYSIPTPTAP